MRRVVPLDWALVLVVLVHVAGAEDAKPAPAQAIPPASSKDTDAVKQAADLPLDSPLKMTDGLKLPEDPDERAAKFKPTEALLSKAQDAAHAAKHAKQKIHDMQTDTVSLQLRAERAMYAARALAKDSRRYGVQARRAQRESKERAAKARKAMTELRELRKKFQMATSKYIGILQLTRHLSKVSNETLLAASSLLKEAQDHRKQAQHWSAEALHLREQSIFDLASANTGESMVEKARVGLHLAMQQLHKATTAAAKDIAYKKIKKQNELLAKGQLLVADRATLRKVGRHERRMAHRYAELSSKLSEKADQELAHQRSGAFMSSLAAQQREHGLGSLKRVAKAWRSLRDAETKSENTAKRLRVEAAQAYYEEQRWTGAAATTTRLAAEKRSFAASLMAKVRALEVKQAQLKARAEQSEAFAKAQFQAAEKNTHRMINGDRR
jgi:hypothetical protein